MILLIFFYCFSVFLVIATLLPFIRKDHWTFRAFEFPRLQKFFLNLLALALGIYLVNENTTVLIVNGVLALNALYIGYLIFPFTPLSKKTMASAKSSASSFKILISNVYQDNTHFDKLRRRIEKVKPEIILLVETDEKWMKALQECTSSYPYRLEHPRDNTYGLLFYSQFPMSESEVRFLIKEDYPSIRTRLQLPNSEFTWFYGVHPPPPSPTERTYSTDRDNELWLVAHEVKDKQEAVIVAGDLNDVAWSYTTDQFIEISGLLDPRRGRGIFATFHAKNILMRWPLDHIFCSDHFALVKMKRLKNIGSDHFPVLVELSASGSRQR